MNSISIGAKAESEALRFLQKQGFRKIATNYRTKMGEIDLILEKEDMLVFVEVRKRLRTDYVSGAETVSWHKQRKLIKTAEHFLQRHANRWQSFRFDVVSIDNDIHWIENAFTLD